MGLRYDAIVLAGGRARRLGGADKPMEIVGQQPMLLRVLQAVDNAQRRVVVGARRDLDADVLWANEDPPGSGPVAAVAVGVQLTSSEVVLLLAADLPWIAAAVQPLCDAIAATSETSEASGTSVALVRSAGRDNYLAAAWRREDLIAALDRVPVHAGAPMRALYDGLEVAVVNDTQGWSQDCDTWEDLAAARQRATIPRHA